MMASSDFLPAQQAELKRLGFEIKKVEPESLIVATGTLFYWDYFLHSIKYTLFIRKGEVLSAPVLENDRIHFEALEKEVHPKSWSNFGPKAHKLLVVYLADIVNTDVQQLFEKKKETRIFDRTYFVAAIALTTGQKFVDKSKPGRGSIYYTNVYHLLNRLLDPLNTPVKQPFSKWSGILSFFLSPWVVLFQFVLLFGFVLELGSLIAGIFSWLN